MRFGEGKFEALCLRWRDQLRATNQLQWGRPGVNKGCWVGLNDPHQSLPPWVIL